MAASRVWVVVALEGEARGAQHDARHAVLAVEQAAQVFGGELGRAADVLRDRRQVFVDPHGRCIGRRCHRVAETAGGAGEHESADLRGCGFFEQLGVPVRLASMKACFECVAT